jgi:hypothetical protein
VIKVGKKYYMHPEAEYKNGKWICTYCGKELPNGEFKTDFPCTTSVETPFDEDVEVRVWDFKAIVYYKGLDISEFCNEKEKEELEKLAIESVESVGGSITWSGFYPPSEELVEFVSHIVEKQHEAIEKALQEKNP